MFFVFNKDKAISYVITVFTVMVLFLTASVFRNKNETLQTSANESKMLETNSINEIEDKKINMVKEIDIN